MHPGLVPYLIKRLLLMIPTLLGVLTLTFVVVQFVPGGPVEQMVLELKGVVLPVLAQGSRLAPVVITGAGKVLKKKFSRDSGFIWL